jgi:hypothetical protein
LAGVRTRQDILLNVKTPVTVETTIKVIEIPVIDIDEGTSIKEEQEEQEDVNQNVLNILDGHPIYGRVEIVETDNNENCLWATLSKMPLESSPLTVRIYVSKHRMDGICGYDGKSWQKYSSDNRGSGNFRTITNILS